MPYSNFRHDIRRRSYRFHYPLHNVRSPAFRRPNIRNLAKFPYKPRDFFFSSVAQAKIELLFSRGNYFVWVAVFEMNLTKINLYLIMLFD